MAWLKGPRGSGDFVEIKDKVRFYDTVEYMDTNKVGETYYVRNNGSNDALGKSPGKAFETLEYAIHHAAGDWDVIRVLPPTDGSAYLVEAVQGVDDDSIPIVISQMGLKIFGGINHPHNLGLPTVHTHVSGTNIFTINVQAVEIAGLNIQAQGTDTTGILMGSTATTPRTYIHDCSFYGVAATLGNYGINAYTFDCSQTVIEHCEFMKWDAAAIQIWGGQGSLIEDCRFMVTTAGQGINWVNNAADRPYGFLLDNRFVTEDGTDGVGINVAGTPNQGHVMIDGNRFVGFADAAHCISKGTDLSYNGVNYFGGTLMTVNA